MRTAGVRIALFVLVVTTIGCDRVTKSLATDHLAGTPRQSFLADTLRFEYARNPGGFLSIGAELPPVVRRAVFAVGTGLLLLALMVMAVRQRWAGAALSGAALICAGGVSNLIDRLLHGSVVDFINVGVGPVRTGIFNVADVAVLAGVALLAFGSTAAPDEPSRVSGLGS